MATKKQDDSCELCGKTGIKLGKNHGLMVCGQCMNIQCNVSRRPEVVIAEIKRMHGDKFFPSGSASPDPDSALLKIFTEIRAALGVDSGPLLSDLPGIVRGVVESLDAAEEKIVAAGETIESLTTANEDLAIQLREVEAECKGLQVELDAWASAPETTDEEIDTLRKEAAKQSGKIAKLEAALIDRNDEIRQLQDDNLNLMERRSAPELIASEAMPQIGCLPGCVLDVSALLADRNLLSAVNVLAGAVR